MAGPLDNEREDDLAGLPGGDSAHLRRTPLPLRNARKRGEERVAGWRASGSRLETREQGRYREVLASPYVFKAVLASLEMLLLAAMGVALARWLQWSAGGWLHVGSLILLTVLLTAWVFRKVGLYRLATMCRLGRSTLLAAFCWLLTIGLITMLAAMAAVGDRYTVSLASYWAAGGFATVLTYRVGLWAGMHRFGWQKALRKRVVIVGGSVDAEGLVRSLEASNTPNLSIAGIFDDRRRTRFSEALVAYPRLGNISELIEFARKHRVDFAIVTFPLTAEDRLFEVTSRLSGLPLHVRIPVSATRIRFRPRSYSYLGSVALLDVFDDPVSDWDYVCKSVFDRVITLAMLPFASVVMLAVALAIKLESRGPVFFIQRRHGFNNRVIKIIKFRTMKASMLDYEATTLVTQDDPRVTRIGRFLRRWSLDELPQLFNVLRGDVSLVGPRPHALTAKAGQRVYSEVVETYFARHRVKPGITGWAQINGWRGETDTPEKLIRRVEHDLYYIEKWSVLFDLYILVRTPFALIFNRNVY